MPDWWLVTMTMMMMTISYSRVCGRARDVLGKIARSKFLIVFKTELTESDCYIKDCTRWRTERGIFIAQFLCLSILDFLRNKKKLLLKLGWFVWGTEFSLKKKKSKRLLSFKHIISKTTKKTDQCEGQNSFQMCTLIPRCEKWLQLCWGFTS